MELAKDAKPKVEVAELDLRQVAPDELAGLLADGPVGVAVRRRRACSRGSRSPPAGRRPPTPRSTDPARSPTGSPIRP